MADDQKLDPAEEYMRNMLKDQEPPEDEPIQQTPKDTIPLDKQPENYIDNPSSVTSSEVEKPVFDKAGRMEDITDSEEKIASIHRHPIGLAIIYAEIIAASILITGFLVFMVPTVIGSSPAVKALIAFSCLFIIIFGLIFLFLASKIYWRNQLIITNINVTQVRQIGLFRKEISELTMANIEDVTVNQRGIFPTMFNFGTLGVHVPGGESDFIFRYCPNPNAYAKTLQDTKMAFMHKNGSSHNI